MEAIVSQSSHENPWDVLWTTFDHLTSTHPIITYSLLIIYVAVVMSGFFTMCAHLPGGPSTIPWLPSIYTTDGFLVCCCPLAAVLPIVLWPVILVAAIIQRLFIWFLAAPTYCGIPRRRCRAWLQALVQYPKGCVNGVKKLYSRQRRSGQRPEILPTSNQSSPTPSSGYGTMHGPGPQAGQYRSPSGREGMRYARPPADQSDGSSFRSVPPPYWP